MISLRLRPEWFRARTLLGYGDDWPITYDELAPYYRAGRAGAERRRPGALSVGTARARRYPTARTS